MSSLYKPYRTKKLSKDLNRFHTIWAMLLWLLFFSLPAWAQYEDLLHKPYGKSVEGIHAMYRDLIDIPDSALRAKKAEEIKSFARKHKDSNLEQNVDFFLNFWNAFYERQSKEDSHTKLTEQVMLAPTAGDTEFFRARSLRALAEFYWKLEQNYERAFEQYLLLDKEIRSTTLDEYPEMARDLMQIGQAYYFFQDYAIAKNYFKRAIELPENRFNTGVLNDARNTLGLCYQRENKLDSADYYFQQVSQASFVEASRWKIVGIGNLGGSMYLRKRYDEAIPLLKKALDGSIAVHDYGYAAGTAISLADIYRNKGKMEQSKAFIDQAQEYIEKTGQADRLRILYPVMSKWHAAQCNVEKATQYLDSTMATLNRHRDKFSAMKVLRAQQKIDRQEEELQLTAFALEREQKIAERNLLILLIGILCGTIALIYFIQKKRQLAKTLELQAATQELEIATLNLNSFAENIQEKNRLIENLEEKLAQNHHVDDDMIGQLQKSIILTEDDWSDFKSLFEQVHAGFLRRLKEKYPGVSPAEIRYLALAKLQLSTKEMAAALGVSTQSIRTNWYRIRKKLKLSDTMTVEELIADI